MRAEMEGDLCSQAVLQPKHRVRLRLAVVGSQQARLVLLASEALVKYQKGHGSLLMYASYVVLQVRIHLLVCNLG